MTRSCLTHRAGVRRRRGTIMVMALWLILVLTVMAYSLAYEMRLGLKSTSYAQKRVKALGLARAGLAHAVMDLKNDRLLSVNAENVSNDRLDEPWAQLEDKLDVEYGEGTYSLLIEDDNRKLDLNALTQQGMTGFAHLLEEVADVREKQALEMANAFLDFRDPDTLPIGGSGSNEVDEWTEYGLEEFGDVLATNWYFRPKNDDLVTLDELLQVPGFTRLMLYGDPDTMELDPFQRAEDDEPSTALADYVTVGSGLVTNINTASPLVIEALLRAAGASKAEVSGLAREIEQLRTERGKIKENNIPGIASLDQLKQAGLPENIVNQMTAAVPVDVRSRMFVITARGEFEGVRETLQVRVTAELEQYPIDPENRRDGLRDEMASGELRQEGDIRYDPAVRVIRNMTP